MSGYRIVIPRAMRPAILGRIHEGHQGIENCREKAPSSVWWPNISCDIVEMCSSCSVCQLHRAANCNAELRPTPLPDRSWSRVGVNFCEHRRQSYLIFVDYYSRWIEIKHMSSTTRRTTARKLIEIFTTHGIPDELVRDHAAQVVATEFRRFLEALGTTMLTSSPHFHQANGAAERAVQTANRILEQPNPNLALSVYRATEHSSTGLSPAQALMSRALETTLPVLPKLLLPHQTPHKDILVADKLVKQRQKLNYDKHHGV